MKNINLMVWRLVWLDGLELIFDEGFHWFVVADERRSEPVVSSESEAAIKLSVEF